MRMSYQSIISLCLIFLMASTSMTFAQTENVSKITNSDVLNTIKDAGDIEYNITEVTDEAIVPVDSEIVGTDEDAIRTSIEEEVRALYANDPEFIMHMDYDPESAEAMIQRIINNLYEFRYGVDTDSISPDENYAWVVAPLIQQKIYYYCGPCNALQAIAAWGGYVSGSTNDAKQDTLAVSMGTVSGGTDVYMVAGVMNDYLSSYYYAYAVGSSMSDLSFKLSVLNSLAVDRAPILHARTVALPYYNGVDSRHYICVSGIDLDTGLIRLVDTNDDDRYFGIRSIARSYAFAAIHNYPDRYLISAYIL